MGQVPPTTPASQFGQIVKVYGGPRDGDTVQLFRTMLQGEELKLPTVGKVQRMAVYEFRETSLHYRRTIVGLETQAAPPDRLVRQEPEDEEDYGYPRPPALSSQEQRVTAAAHITMGVVLTTLLVGLCFFLRR